MPASATFFVGGSTPWVERYGSEEAMAPAAVPEDAAEAGGVSVGCVAQ